jgi:hypothetical protein
MILQDYLELQVLRVFLEHQVQQVRLVMLEPREPLALKVQLELQVLKVYCFSWFCMTFKYEDSQTRIINN